MTKLEGIKMRNKYNWYDDVEKPEKNSESEKQSSHSNPNTFNKNRWKEIKTSKSNTEKLLSVLWRVIL